MPPPQLGSTVAQLMLDQLVSAETFRVLDGEWLQYGSREAGDRRFGVLRDNAEQAGVDYLVLGSITKFSNENRQRTVGGAGLRPSADWRSPQTEGRTRRLDSRPRRGRPIR